MTTALADNDELKVNFEKWLLEKIKQYDTEVDETLASYISSIVSDEDTPDEDKKESIEPILQELNQNDIFGVSELAKEIIEWWNKIKVDFDALKLVRQSQNSNEPDTLSTISSMIKSHEKKTETKKKTSTTGEYGTIDGDEEDDQEDGCVLPANTNAQNAAAVEKARRDKIAEAHLKQKEQTKKAAIDHAAREEEKKRKAKEKVAKQERRK